MKLIDKNVKHPHNLVDFFSTGISNVQVVVLLRQGNNSYAGRILVQHSGRPFTRGAKCSAVVYLDGYMGYGICDDPHAGRPGKAALTDMQMFEKKRVRTFVRSYDMTEDFPLKGESCRWAFEAVGFIWMNVL